VPRQIDHAVVGVMVERDGKILIVQESKPGREGLFSIPGGHVEDHETLLEAAIREVKEESGYEVELTGLIGVFQTVRPHINVSGPVFGARITGGSAVASKEHPEVRWVTIEELRDLQKAQRMFTLYQLHAAERLLAGKLLSLDAVNCEITEG
jgi:8-oxo-dGTP diphosphatase